MKKLLLLAPLFAVLATAASATETPAMDQAARLANGTPAGPMMDGSRTQPGTAAANAIPPGQRTVTMGSGATVAVGRRTTGTPPAPEAKKPGFFSRTLAAVSKPGMLVPGIMGLGMGAMGFMIGGPLGALTGLAIGGLLGLIFSKAMG